MQFRGLQSCSEAKSEKNKRPGCVSAGLWAVCQLPHPFPKNTSSSDPCTTKPISCTAWMAGTKPRLFSRNADTLHPQDTLTSPLMWVLSDALALLWNIPCYSECTQQCAALVQSYLVLSPSHSIYFRDDYMPVCRQQNMIKLKMDVQFMPAEGQNWSDRAELGIWKNQLGTSRVS